MCQKGDIGNFSYEQQKDGTFLYKAKNPLQPIPLVKKKDKPQFKVINSMEQKMKESGKKMIDSIAIDTLKFLKQLK